MLNFSSKELWRHLSITAECRGKLIRDFVLKVFIGAGHIDTLCSAHTKIQTARRKTGIPAVCRG